MPSERTYPPRLTIEPLAKPPKAVVSVPGSKSITNRALVLAALQSRVYECELHGALQSEDTEVMVRGLHQLGYQTQTAWPTIRVKARIRDRRLVPNDSADIHVANSGTTMRFL